MSKLVFLCLMTVLGIPAVMSQCVNRQPNVILNRPMQEAIIETPINFNPQGPLFQPKVIEAQNSVYPTPTTIITDCTPSVCKNLVNIIELMTVCNLMRNKRGGLDQPLQVSAPIINELLSSPSIINGLPNQLLPNAIASNIPPSVISPVSSIYPNLIGSPNMISHMPAAISPNLGVANSNPSAIIGNILSMLGN